MRNYSQDIAPLLRFKPSYDRLQAALKEVRALSTEVYGIENSLRTQLERIPTEITNIKKARLKTQNQKNKEVAAKEKLQETIRKDMQIIPLYSDLNSAIVQAIQKIVDDYGKITK